MTAATAHVFSDALPLSQGTFDTCTNPIPGQRVLSFRSLTHQRISNFSRSTFTCRLPATLDMITDPVTLHLTCQKSTTNRRDTVLLTLLSEAHHPALHPAHRSQLGRANDVVLAQIVVKHCERGLCRRSVADQSRRHSHPGNLVVRVNGAFSSQNKTNYGDRQIITSNPKHG